ncbi:phosphofructokinase [Desulfovibrio sp. X2]|uniref:ATP-dependent 6-phosphofructokinase n=1 Tax=Desulfovibrio sp. X2 TaxID=941449 RepID=UPI000358EE29|nr:ATP-dependent 6-phosphofructokinase [Desulfovibrio sp. X2]EPR44041.1 phosphofructokinase [Desulfovibrio sp. X2]
MARRGKKTLFSTTIPVLGELAHVSPLSYCRFVSDEARMRIELTEEEVTGLKAGELLALDFEIAGPRQELYFNPSKTKCAVVTCGGLCPGINDVIRSIVMEAYHTYDVAACLGIRFGLQGFMASYGHDVAELDPDNVANIHEFGGTILGSSRGPQPAEDIVDALERMNVGILFVIGGDGTMKAARAIQAEVHKRDLRISVIGIPKTIDNDINFISRSFGFDTAVEQATKAIRSAHIEAEGAFNGIGMVKLMGRHSGFIAAQSALALKEVNFVLIPEYPFELTGENGLLAALEDRLRKRRHAVIVVAEGAGQHLLDVRKERDASGNIRLGDISSLLRQEIADYLSARGISHTLKFIDPSYIIRSVPANSNDRVYCGFLGQNAVHAAMAGKTGMVVARVQDRYVHLPFDLVTSARKKLNIHSDFWRAVLESTGQQHLGPDPDACVPDFLHE